VGGIALDNIPTRPFNAIRRDTRIFLLRIFGRTTPPWAVLATALLLSAAAGFAEEFAFRGFLFNLVSSSFGLMWGTAVSSLLFGLAHFPLFGVSTVVETLFGLIFALSYIASG
jgi:membrane protease YdiL (CAAX protease family)